MEGKAQSGIVPQTMMGMGRKGKEQGERGALLRPSREDSGTGNVTEEKGNEQLITGQLGELVPQVRVPAWSSLLLAPLSGPGASDDLTV